MSQLLQVLTGGIEFWKCLNCGRVRKILPDQAASVFLVPPEFCSVRCMRRYMGSGRRRDNGLRDQMSFWEINDRAINE